MPSQKFLAKMTLTLAGLTLLNGLNAHATVTLLNKNDWKFSTTGFIESDYISDSTRSFGDLIANSPVVSDSTSSGANGQTQFSIRNSRIGFGLSAPTAGDWKSKAYFEMDFMGYDPSAGTSNSEGGFYTNPTERIRHAYLQASSGHLSLLAGQTWEILGYQPYYFLATADIGPIPGSLYNRTPQLRASYNFDLNSNSALQTEFGIMRPPQAGAQMPDLQAGVRWVMGSRKSGFTGGSTGARALQPMSIALSGDLRRFSVPDSTGAANVENKFMGGAWAADALIPILSSSDNKSVANTLTLVGEYSMGSGYGDQFPHWTGNLPSNLAAASTGTTKTIEGKHPFSLDGGIGDYNNASQFELLKLQSYNLQLQYHFASPYWIGVGYSEIYSSNLADVTTSGLTSANSAGYDRDRALFANLFHDFTPQLRGALEYAYVDTHYVNGSKAANNRIQASVWFIF